VAAALLVLLPALALLLLLCRWRAALRGVGVPLRAAPAQRHSQGGGAPQQLRQQHHSRAAPL
jgi:hypothetical protein